jgi:hypothetical protein
VANLLQKLIQNVLLHPSYENSWATLLRFTTACLAKPSRGGKSRNLATNIVKQVRQYDTGVEPSPAPPSRHSAHCAMPVKSPDQVIATMASAKLEDGDVKGAVRLLCSDDKLAAPDSATFNELRRLHPAAPADRRPAPTADTPPLQVLPAAVKAAIQLFPNG